VAAVARADFEMWTPGATADETTVCWGRGISGELGSGSDNSTAPVPLPPR
jgi:hypothetical protein